MFYRFIKRILHYFIGNTPFNTISYKQFFTTTYSPVEQPEKLHLILKHETGTTFWYGENTNVLNQPFHYRKLNNEERYIRSGIFVENQRVLMSMSNGAIVTEIGIVYYPPTRTAIEESAVERDFKLIHNKVFSSFRVSKPQHFEDIALSICTIWSDGGFYHFFHEALPKLFFSKEILPYVKYLLISGDDLPWKLKWLKALDLKLPEIKWIKREAHYSFKQLIFTNPVVKEHQLSPWSTSALKQLYAHIIKKFAQLPVTKTIWATRRNDASRIFFWEDEIQKHYPEIQFVEFNALSVDDTIKICSETKLFIAPHGASLSNLVFCKEGIKVLEIFQDFDYIPLYGRLCNVLKINHYYAQLPFESNNFSASLEIFSSIYEKVKSS